MKKAILHINVPIINYPVNNTIKLNLMRHLFIILYNILHLQYIITVLSFDFSINKLHKKIYLND